MWKLSIGRVLVQRMRRKTNQHLCIKPDPVNALIFARACGVRPHVLVGIQRELILLTRFARGGRCIEPVSGLICTA